MKSNYASVADWTSKTDILRCTPDFYNHPRYDFVLLDTNDGPVFARLILVFECIVCGSKFPLLLVQPLDNKPGRVHYREDNDLGFYRVREQKRSASRLYSIYSVIRGTLIVEDFGFTPLSEDGELIQEYLVVDVVDSDMFLRMQTLSYQGKC